MLLQLHVEPLACQLGELRRQSSRQELVVLGIVCGSQGCGPTWWIVKCAFAAPPFVLHDHAYCLGLHGLGIMWCELLLTSQGLSDCDKRGCSKPSVCMMLRRGGSWCCRYGPVELEDTLLCPVMYSMHAHSCVCTVHYAR